MKSAGVKITLVRQSKPRHGGSLDNSNYASTDCVLSGVLQRVPSGARKRVACDENARRESGRDGLGQTSGSQRRGKTGDESNIAEEPELLF